jgi:hypothetical protein
MDSAMSPIFQAGWLEAITSPTPPPCMTSPIATPLV